MKISQRAARIEPFYVLEVAKAASALAQQVAHTDSPMIFLNIGEPDFTAPPLVQQAASRAIAQGNTQYTQAMGLPALRERISGIASRLPGADRVRRRNFDARPELSVQPAFCQRS